MSSCLLSWVKHDFSKVTQPIHLIESLFLAMNVDRSWKYNQMLICLVKSCIWIHLMLKLQQSWTIWNWSSVRAQTALRSGALCVKKPHSPRAERRSPSAATRPAHRNGFSSGPARTRRTEGRHRSTAKICLRPSRITYHFYLDFSNSYRHL